MSTTLLAKRRRGKVRIPGARGGSAQREATRRTYKVWLRQSWHAGLHKVNIYPFTESLHNIIHLYSFLIYDKLMLHISLVFPPAHAG